MKTGLVRVLTTALLAALVGLGVILMTLLGRRPRPRPGIATPVAELVPLAAPAPAASRARGGRGAAIALIALLLLAGLGGVVYESRDGLSGSTEGSSEQRPLAALSPPAADAPEARLDASAGADGTPAAAPRATARSGARPDPAPDTAATPQPGAPGAPQTPGEPAAGPRFDVVRVEPNGEAVIAGQAAPNAVVELLVNGKPVASARTTADGRFTVLPPALPAGSSEIGLRETGVGGTPRQGSTTVAVALAPSRDTKPLIALTSPDTPTVVLSRPDEATAPRPDSGQPARQGDTVTAGMPPKVVSIDVQEGGKLSVTGRASPGASVRLYLNDTLIAPATVDRNGTVTFTIGRGVKPGAYTARLDLVDPATGKVRNRAEVPFTAPEPGRDGGVEVAAGDRESGHGPSPSPGAMAGGDAGHRDRPAAAPQPSRTGSLAANAPAGTGTNEVYVPAIETARIERGDSLWRISRRTYGEGLRYTLIYDANQDQIRDPDLIYPGQVLVLPAPGGPRD